MPEGATLILILSDINMPGMSGLELLPKAGHAARRAGDHDHRLWRCGHQAQSAGERRRGAATKPIDFVALREEIEQRRSSGRMSASILVVDDEPDLESLLLQKFRRQIRDGTFRFLFARDGVEALAVLGANPDVDMVVSDINMPRMDGLLLLSKLQERDRDLSTIIVSAYSDMTNIRTAMKPRRVSIS